jgi:iron complex outermembrane receptor protein
MRPNLYRGASAVALAAVSTLGISAAYAQGSDSIETVTVTGTSIRGVAPVGANLVTVGQEEIETLSPATVNQLLTNVPSITGLSSDGRGQSGNGGAGSSIYIHEVGASAQNSTLVILDGHRIPISGSSNAVVDPSIIPQAMVQRVDILADGASTTYGSDAVAGVVNFITRKSFDGMQIHYQAEVEHGSAVGTIASFLAGHSWDGGGFVGSYDYTFEGDIHNTSDWETNPLVQPQRAAADGLVTTTGSTTYFGTFNCDPATIQPGGAGNIYLNAQGTSNVANTVPNSPCTNWAAGSLVAAETTQHAMMKFNQNITPNLNFSMDALWANKVSNTNVANATLTATAFGPGSGTQANPFYTNPPGVTATKQTIRYDFTDLIGPAVSHAGNSALVGVAELNWNVDDNWNLDALANIGTSDEFSGPSSNLVNSSVADLALNGSPNTAGTIATATATSTAIANTQTSVNGLPLTTSNALDVWNPLATNRTSAAELALLKAPGSNESITHGINSYQQYRLLANGTLFTLPGGPLKVAAGLEQFNSQKTVSSLTNGNTGPSTVSSGYSIQVNGRTVQSEFAEADIPIVNAGMGIPFMQSFELNLAVRHDDYSDFGGTTNPKVAFNWDVMDGLRLRANWSTSFVAPDLFHDIGPGGVNGTTSPGSGLGSLPVSVYPQLTQLGIAGCTTASLTCNTATINGVQSSAINRNLKPELGRTWSLGFDYLPSWLEGFTSAASWWTVHYFGGATGPANASGAAEDAYNPLINYRIVLFPPTPARGNQPCATAAELQTLTLGVPFTAALPACISYLQYTYTDNLLNFWASGLDMSLQYAFDTDYGKFTIGDDLSEGLTFLQGFGSGGIVPTAATRYETENTDGLNGTFPDVQTQMRVHLDWTMDDFLGGIGMNFTGAYRNASTTATVVIGQTANMVYNNTGGDPVHANKVFDAHIGYHFNGGYLGDDQIMFTARNLLNSSPPYYNGASGYDSFVGSPIGRILELSLTGKF